MSNVNCHLLVDERLLRNESKRASSGRAFTPFTFGMNTATSFTIVSALSAVVRNCRKSIHRFSFSDVARKVVSIVNLASVAAIENLVGMPVHPLRFRANLYVTGWPAWREFDLVGQEIAIGKEEARLKIVKPIVRCAAIDVDPDTGIRDLSIPHALMRSFGHANCGVYAEVVNAGEIVPGNELRG